MYLASLNCRLGESWQKKSGASEVNIRILEGTHAMIAVALNFTLVERTDSHIQSIAESYRKTCLPDAEYRLRQNEFGIRKLQL